MGPGMKKIAVIAFLYSAVLSFSVMAQEWTCDYYLPQCQSKASKYDAEYAEIQDKYKAKKISIVELAKQAMELTAKMYPKDKTLNGMSKQQYTLINFVMESSADQQYKTQLISLNGELMDDLIKDRFQMANALSDMDGQIQRQQQAQQGGNNAVATATLLNGIGRAFNSSFGQSITPPMQICSYYGNTRYCQ